MKNSSNIVVVTVLVLCALLSLLAIIYGIGGGEHVSTIETQARIDMHQVVRLIEAAIIMEYELGPPPNSSYELSVWLEGYLESNGEDVANLACWSSGHNVLVDAWGEQLKVISKEGEFFGLASNGPNRADDGGCFDDFIVTQDGVIEQAGK